MSDVKHLKVPRAWADKLEIMAEFEGFEGSAKWAEYSRHRLKNFIDDYDFSKKGDEKDAAPAEDMATGKPQTSDPVGA